MTTCAWCRGMVMGGRFWHDPRCVVMLLMPDVIAWATKQTPRPELHKEGE